MFPVTFANEHWVSRGSRCLTVTVFFLGGGGGGGQAVNTHLKYLSNPLH